MEILQILLLQFHHNFQPVQNTEASWDKNSETGAGEHSKVDKDALNLYTPIVDDMGHVVGKNIERLLFLTVLKLFLLMEQVVMFQI